jgi:hypothetical protein
MTAARPVQSIAEMIAAVHRDALPTRWFEDADKAIQFERSAPGRNAFFDAVHTRLAVAESELVLFRPKSDADGGFEIGRYHLEYPEGIYFAASPRGIELLKLSSTSVGATESQFKAHLQQTLRKIIS